MNIFPRIVIFKQALLLGSFAGMALMPVAAQESPKTPCSVEQMKADIAAMPPDVSAALQGMFTSTRCSSIANLLRMASRKKVNAGRKLEGDRATSFDEAERQLQEARMDPSIQAAIKIELAGETNDIRKMFLEAVVMGDKGKVLARDILLNTIQSGQRP